jgi:hypothetical protein
LEARQWQRVRGRNGQAEQGQGHHTEFIPRWSFSHHAQSANVEIGVPGVCEFTPLFYQCLSVSICGSMGRCFASKTLVKKHLVAAMLRYDFHRIKSVCTFFRFCVIVRHNCDFRFFPGMALYLIQQGCPSLSSSGDYFQQSKDLSYVYKKSAGTLCCFFHFRL